MDTIHFITVLTTVIIPITQTTIDLGAAIIMVIPLIMILMVMVMDMDMDMAILIITTMVMVTLTILITHQILTITDMIAMAKELHTVPIRIEVIEVFPP